MSRNSPVGVWPRRFLLSWWISFPLYIFFVLNRVIFGFLSNLCVVPTDGAKLFRLKTMDPRQALLREMKIDLDPIKVGMRIICTTNTRN